MYHGSVVHVGELDCIRNRWAIISELYFTGIAVEQPIIRHAEGSTIELYALQVTKHCSVQNCCLDGGCTARPYIAIGQGGQLPPPPDNLTKVITSELTLHVYSKMLIVRKILNNAHCHVTDQQCMHALLMTAVYM